MPTSAGGSKPGGRPVVRRPVPARTPIPKPTPNSTPGSEQSGMKGSEAPEGAKRVRPDITTRGSGSDKAKASETDRQPAKPGDTTKPGDLFTDLANSAGDHTGPPQIDGEKPAGKGSQGDAPVALGEKEIAGQVRAILEKDKVLHRFPQVQELVESRINALAPGDRVGVAEQVREWTQKPEMRQAFKKLTDEHARGLLEEIGLVKERPRLTAGQRAQGVTNNLEEWLNNEVGKLNANATEIATLREQIESARTPAEAEAIKMAADPRLWEEATRPPAPRDERTSTERAYDIHAANERFEKIVKELSDKTLSEKQRRKLMGWLAVEFLLAGIQAAVPPER